MAVIKANEVLINAKRYKIKGLVQPRLASIYPEKTVIGDYTKDDEKDLSNWIIYDQRGGILVEEMDEKTQSDRNWWSNLIDSFKGHGTLPRLATLVKADKDIDPTDFLEGGWADEAKAYNNDISDYAANTNIGNQEWGANIELIIASTDDVRAIRFYASGSEAGITKMSLHVYNGSWHTVVSDGVFTYNTWTIEALSTILDGVTRVRFKFWNNTAGDKHAYLHDVDFIQQADSGGTPRCWKNFNSQLYVGIDTEVQELDTTTNAFFMLPEKLPANILTLEASVGNNLYIGLGDTKNYWYMSTAKAFTQTNATGVTLLKHWDNKLHKMDSAGDMYACAAPNSATPNWGSSVGNLADEGIADGEINNLEVYRDASGNPIIYAATRVGLFAHDTTTAKWIETELALPQHPNSGKGVVVWHDALWVSAGLSVKRYIAATTASIAKVGLDQDDGLPAKYRGEIVKFIKGDNEYFALVDASQVTGTGYSGVYAHNGEVWECWWIAAAADKVMTSGIVSSVSARRLWYDHDGKIYYIALQRDIRNPKQITDFPYGAAGIRISPWFDAGTAHNKLAVKAKIELKDITADETAALYYRINHIYTNVDTGWNLIKLIDATELGAAYGEKAYTFASQAGLLFRSIQFRCDEARSSSDNTLSPDILKLSLAYKKRLPPTYGWEMTLDFTSGYKGRSPEQMKEDIQAIITAGLLVPFVFTHTTGATSRVAETHYVDITGFAGQESSGKDKFGSYNLSLVAPA